MAISRYYPPICYAVIDIVPGDSHVASLLGMTGLLIIFTAQNTNLQKHVEEAPMRKCYPGGRSKAINITYDDGVLQDVPFVAMLNRYGLKGTFNLNSQLMAEEFAWTHANGMQVRRLDPATAQRLYDGHEVASHTLTHPYMKDLPTEEILRQMREDKRALERLFGREVRGFAVPFDYFDDRIAGCAQQVGFAYARTSDLSFHYQPCGEYYGWKAGIYHILPELSSYVDGFFNTRKELAVCQIVGHSYDLDAENLWDTMEAVCCRVSEDGDIWPCTHWELVRYLRAMDAFDGVNRSDQTLWFAQDGVRFALHPGESL